MGVVFLGPPGVGKGTQGLRVAEHYHGVHVSTGEMLRAAVREGTDLGKKVAQVLEQGQLVSDDLMVDLIKERLNRPDASHRFLLDGFPRTIGQARALDRFLESQGRELTAAVLLVADPNEIQKRLLARAKDLGRSDDTPETIANRLKVYSQQTAPLVEYYEQRGKLIRIDGMGSMNDVFERIISRLSTRSDSSGR